MTRTHPGLFSRSWRGAGLLGVLLAALVAAAACGGVAPPPPPYAPAHRGLDVDVSFFYDDLSPYGSWFWVDSYGWVWTPNGVRSDWRPYTEGRWVFTDYGWTWVSDFEWGWAPFHYGRWAYEPGYGWLWVPGREWAPAWVVWRHGGGYVGWAPLPPQVGFRAGLGLEWGDVDLRVAIHPTHYCFVEERYLYEAAVRRHFVPVTRSVTLVQVTQNITNYTLVNSRIVNRSVALESIERASGRVVPRYRVSDAPSTNAVRHTTVQGDTVTMFRPAVAEGPAHAAPRAPIHPVPRPTARPLEPAPPAPRPAEGATEVAVPRKPTPTSVQKRPEAEPRVREPHAGPDSKVLESPPEKHPAESGEAAKPRPGETKAGEMRATGAKPAEKAKQKEKDKKDKKDKDKEKAKPREKEQER